MLPEPGQSFGPYDVVDRIGNGAMGVVYRAVHRDLEREVALKVLAPQLSSDPDYRVRFLSEARTLARLESHHIVGIYDAGERDGWLYLAMQLVTDGDLADWMRAHGPVPPALALDLLRQLADGLGTAHAAGVLHRDVKTSNVLVRRLPDGGLRAYLCDFGIAQADGVSHTRTGGLIGTWTYLAPERHHGAPASEASDMYAMGCLLWVMLTGRPPYEGSTEMAVALAHVNAPVPQLSEASPLDARINALLRGLLEKDPGRRIRTAGGLVAAIDAIGVGGGGTVAAGTRYATGAAPGGVAGGGGTRTGGAGTGSREHHAYASPAPQRAGRGRWWLAAVLALVVVVGGSTAVVLTLGRDGGGTPGGDPTEVPYADDTEAGVVDAPLTVSACEEGTEPSDGQLRIGALAPETSVFATQSPAVSAGVGLAISDINDAGGVDGVEVCSVTAEALGEEATDDLVDAGVSAVVGGFETLETGAVANRLAGDDVTYFIPGAYNTPLEGGQDFVYRLIADSASLGWAMADQLAGGLSVGVVSTAEEPYGADRQGVVDAFERQSMDCAYGCTADEVLPSGFTDWAGLVATLQNREVTHLAVPDLSVTLPLLTALDEAGWTGEVVLGMNAVSEDLSSLSPELRAGITGLFPTRTPDDAFRQRLVEWAAASGAPTLTSIGGSSESYDGAVLAALAAVRGGAVDGTTIDENVRAVSGSEGGTQCVTFRRCAALLEAGEEVVYRGLAVAGPLDEDHELSAAGFDVFSFAEVGTGERTGESVIGRRE
ncbi:bifunctional serine/threonine-protein kinase/ABC transporter substrate-binding protein [Nocardioides zeae]|uniref:non-specific serine/threonine protein kinase n=1 Tax=Nocardioides imazamoxiresistens TaxID=3231893 RepID=A0ABU3Q0W3_9ACTN|nr:bifunctional serine/threonine-protein kinase/ABC transporter substrate-binding protein [Nocardioides zeae]MDT9595081.1 bifunctional serine/threonine-protein kinase/ABC transporter substrate-binding protein [Nocardioides zeae]